MYGDLDQLVRENNQSANKTYTYSYDLRGNIVFKVEYAYTKGTLGQALDTIVYDYDTSWDDLLISYDGNTITSDNIGNPLSDGTWNYQWEHGRQLDSMSKSGTSIDYSYDSDGLRTSKTVNGVTTKYEYLGGNLVQMEQGSNKLRFTYDALGASGVIFNGTNYYYEKNAQGDILGIVDTNRNFVVNYNYDAWGTLLSTTGSMANTLGELNPLRYRGYVYDNETNFYYLQSRYYNPAMGRFINADSIVDTEQGLNSTNMFAYCGNNPVYRIDDTGEFWNVVIGAVVGGFLNGATSIVSQVIDKGFENIDWGLVGISTASGMLSGAVAATGLSAFAQAGISSLISAGTNVAEQVYTKGIENINFVDVAINGALGFGTSALGGKVGGTIGKSVKDKSNTLIASGDSKFLTAFDRMVNNKSFSSYLRQSDSYYKQSIILTNTFRGISSVSGSIIAMDVMLLYNIYNITNSK